MKTGTKERGMGVMEIIQIFEECYENSSFKIKNMTWKPVYENINW